MAQNVRIKNLSQSDTIIIAGVSLAPRADHLFDVSVTGSPGDIMHADLRHWLRRGKILVTAFS